MPIRFVARQRLGTPPWVRAVAAAGALCAATMASAMSLTEAFEAARAHDPQYRAGDYDLAAARESVPLARSALMPQVTLNHSSIGYSGTRTFPNSLQQDVTTSVDYAAPSTSLSLLSAALFLSME